jgi:hypothetical protein
MAAQEGKKKKTQKTHHTHTHSWHLVRWYTEKFYFHTQNGCWLGKCTGRVSWFGYRIWFHVAIGIQGSWKLRVVFALGCTSIGSVPQRLLLRFEDGRKPLRFFATSGAQFLFSLFIRVLCWRPVVAAPICRSWSRLSHYMSTEEIWTFFAGVAPRWSSDLTNIGYHAGSAAWQQSSKKLPCARVLKIELAQCSSGYMSYDFDLSLSCLPSTVLRIRCRTSGPFA